MLYLGVVFGLTRPNGEYELSILTADSNTFFSFRFNARLRSDGGTNLENMLSFMKNANTEIVLALKQILSLYGHRMKGHGVAAEKAHGLAANLVSD